MDAYYCPGALAVIYGVKQRGIRENKYTGKNSEGVSAFRILFQTLYTCLLSYLSTDQLSLPLTFHLLDRYLPLHGRFSIW